MNPSTLTRDAKRVLDSWSTTKDGQMLTAKPCKIIVPARWTEQNLADVGTVTRTMAIFAIVMDDKYYAVSNAAAMMRLTPTETNTIKVGSDDYLEFFFEAGSVVCPNINLVKDDTLPYRMYNEFFAKGRVPWYISYEDLGRIYESAPYHANLQVGANHAVPELMAAAICRSEKDVTRYYRHVVEGEQDLVMNPPVTIPLKDVSLGATNTTARLMGSYFNDGLVSSLVNPSDRVEPIENLLRQ